MTDTSTSPARTVDDKRRLLAARLAEAGADRRTGPVSFAQRRLWILDQLVPASSAYNVPIVFRTALAPDEAALRDALAEVIRRHEALRTVFVARDGVPVQQVRPPFVPEIAHADTSAGEDPGPAADDLLRAFVNEPFNLATGPLLRALVIRVAPDEHLIVLAVHHIVCDGWSVVTLFRELDQLYDRFHNGAEVTLPPLPLQYLEYAAWQRRQLTGERLAELSGYWSSQLTGAPGLLQLPMDRARPTGHRVNGGTQEFLLPEPVAVAAHKFATEHGTTPFVVLMACFAALMSRYSGQDDIVLGVPVAGQQRREFENLVGFFVNTLVMRVDLTGGPSLREAVERARTVTLDAFSHQDMPFEKLVVDLQPDRNPTATPIFQVLFNYQVGSDERLRLPHLHADLVPFDSGIVRFDLELNLYAQEHRTGGTWVFNRELFDPATVARMSHVFARITEAALDRPDVALAELDVLDDADLAEIARVAGTPGGPAEPADPVGDAVRWWAARTPDAPAVTVDGRTRSYREIVAEAAGLTGRLRSAGVGAGVPVEIDAPASARVAALLGVLGAGAVPATTGPGAARLTLSADGSVRVDHRPAGATPELVDQHVHRRCRDLPVPAGDTVLVAARPGLAAADDLLWPLACGAELILAGPDEVAGQLADRRVHTMLIAPTLLRQVLTGADETRPLRVDRIVCAGEPLSSALERDCLAALPGTELYYAYRGPYGGDVARRRCRGDLAPGRDVAGTVVGGVAVRVLDAYGRPAPIGVAGEIHVAEAGGDPRPTGDLGRLREDGSLELHGPLDGQVYQRQVRVPHGEVEACLLAYDAVADARIGAHVDDETTELRVVAYVVPVPGALDIVEGLRAHAQRLLPGVLVPRTYIVLDRLPVTGAGTLDRDRLPAPSLADAVPPAQPRDDLEQALLDIWRSVLGTDAIGVHDNFFLAGGHSLLAVQVMIRIRRSLGVDLPVSVLFRYRTIADLAARIATLHTATVDRDTSLVHIQSGTATPALALVHPAGGSVFCYASLATALTDRTVYAFEARHPAASLAERATRYLDELPGDVPCHLGGWSLGGAVAYEMAHQLVARGHAPVPLVLIDSFLFEGDPAAPDTHRYLLNSFLRDLMADLDLAMPPLPPNAELLPPRRLLADVLEALGPNAPAGLDLDEVLRRHDVYRGTMLNLAGYRPPGRYPGEMHLIQATGSPDAAETWRPLVDRLTVHRVEADHYSIMRNPRLTRVARIIENVLAVSS